MSRNPRFVWKDKPRKTVCEFILWGQPSLKTLEKKSKMQTNKFQDPSYSYNLQFYSPSGHVPVRESMTASCQSVGRSSPPCRPDCPWCTGPHFHVTTKWLIAIVQRIEEPTSNLNRERHISIWLNHNLLILFLFASYFRLNNLVCLLNVKQSSTVWSIK